MTNQEAFDKMMSHLRSLKNRSMDDLGNACSYNGAKCAVGALMTDEEQETFGESEEDVLVLLDEMEREEHESELHDLNSWMLMEMQYLHDLRFNWSAKGFKGEAKAKEIAEKYDLKYTAPETNNI